jgi:nicotinate phosphoribosyltransferase
MGALWTDLYELKMAASYLRRGMAGPATFSLFVRHLPSDRAHGHRPPRRAIGHGVR